MTTEANTPPPVLTAKNLGIQFGGLKAVSDFNIEQTHENGNHQTAVVKIFILVHFFDNNNSAIGRSHYDVVSVLDAEITDGATKKV